MKPFSEKALTEKAEKWEEKAFPEQGIDPDYAYDDVIEGFISGWRAREEDLRALLKGAAPLLKPHELQPCPFCGNELIVSKAYHSALDKAGRWRENLLLGYFVHHADFESSKKCPSYDYVYSNKKRAVEVWNHRASIQKRELLAELEKDGEGK